MEFKKLIYVGLLWTYPTIGAAQEWVETEDNRDQQFYEQVERFKQHPLDINQCGEADLRFFPFLSEETIQSILTHRQQFGKFIDLLELQQTNLTHEERTFLLPYITIHPADQFITGNLKSHVLVVTTQRQFPDKQGYKSDGGYQGDAHKFVLRYRGHWSSKISVNYTGEKDPGEVLGFTQGQKGLDYNSGNMCFTQLGPFEQIIVGDYRADFGQGLTIGSGMRVGKSVLALNNIKAAQGIRPYTSLNEQLSMRGMAFSGKTRHIHYDAWIHRKKLDARLEELKGVPVVSSITTTGLHRTDTEVERKQQLPSHQLGLHAGIKLRGVRLDASMVNHRQQHAFQPRDEVYQQFQFAGKSYSKMGLAYQYVIKNTFLFGETTWCSNRSVGTLFGTISSLTSHIGLSTLFRHYAPSFIGQHSVSFSESSSINNETGVYLGSVMVVSRQLTVSAYIDHYWFPWMTYRSVGPSSGSDYLVHVKYNINKSLWWSARYKYEQTWTNGEVLNGFRPLTLKRTSKFRFHVQSDVNKRLGLRSRIEVSRCTDEQTSWGIMMYQDVRWRLTKLPLKLYWRIATAYIDRFENRIYTYENDVAYSYALPFYQDPQYRSYVLVQYAVGSNIDCWLKVAVDYKSYGKGFGSGLESVSSPRRTDIKLQIRLSI